MTSVTCNLWEFVIDLLFGTRAEYIVLPEDYTFKHEYKHFEKSLCGSGVVICMSAIEYYVFSF